MKFTDDQVARAERAYAEACGGLVPHDRPMRAAIEAAMADELDIGATDFDEFWHRYPRHAKKPDAAKAYKGARTGKEKATHAQIMAGVTRLVAENRDPQYIPYPASWLRAAGWNDQPVRKVLTGIDGQIDRLRQRITDEQGMERTRGADPQDARRLSYGDR